MGRVRRRHGPGHTERVKTRWGRLAVIPLALSLVTAGACARRSPSAGPARVGSGLTADGTGTSSTTATTSTAGAPSAGRAPGARRPTASGGSGGSSPSGGGAAATNPVATDATGGPGALARDLLQPQPAATDVLDLLYQGGATPDAHAVSHLRSQLGSVSGKSVGLSEAAISGGGRDWTADQLRQLADDSTRLHQGGGQAVIHLLYLHGAFQGDTSVLGITVRADVIAVFKDQVAAAATPLAPPARVEDAVTMHEAGHVLGLVDLVLHTGRQDPAHPGHSKNKGSVMYWAIDSDLFSQVLSGPPPVDFDSDDLADLATIRRGG